MCSCISEDSLAKLEAKAFQDGPRLGFSGGPAMTSPPASDCPQCSGTGKTDPFHIDPNWPVRFKNPMKGKWPAMRVKVGKWGGLQCEALDVAVCWGMDGAANHRGYRAPEWDIENLPAHWRAS